MYGSRNFCQGGQGPTARKQPERFFLYLFFFSPQLIFTVYRGGQMVLLQRKLYFSKDPEGIQHFPGGSNFFQGGGGGSKC